MRVCVLFNPIAGLGKGASVVADIEQALLADGHDVCLSQTSAEGVDTGALADAELLVVAGGDGTMRTAADAAVHAGVSVYHYPQGTENLFARSFGMKAGIDTLRAAIARFTVLNVDTALVNSNRFLLMVSAGFDAAVIHDLAARRTGSIRHISYVAPIIRSLWRFRAPIITVETDGQTLIDGQRGMVIIANSREYAFRFDPARKASLTDGALDVVFLPVASRLDIVRWAIRVRRGRHLHNDRLVYATAAQVVVRLRPEETRAQVDGDPLAIESRVGELDIRIDPASLSVLDAR